jgi:hypothetical protein
MTETSPTCPHCGSSLVKWHVPEDTTWSEEFFLVCFNDECAYYQAGWDWMKEHYNQHVSYRYAFNPVTGTSFMIPVWSDTATREMIEDDGNGGSK